MAYKRISPNISYFNLRDVENPLEVRNIVNNACQNIEGMEKVNVASHDFVDTYLLEGATISVGNNTRSDCTFEIWSPKESVRASVASKLESSGFKLVKVVKVVK